MKWILIIYTIGYGGTVVPVLHDFSTQKQCETIRQHIAEKELPTMFSINRVRMEGSECLEVKR